MNALSGKNIPLPANSTFIGVLTKEFNETKADIIEVLRKAKKVCTTSDCWSSRAQHFLGVTAHIINEETLERYSFLVAFRKITGRTTYDVLGQSLFDIHNEYGLNIEKLTHTVTDGGSNYCKAFRVYGNTTSGSTLDETLNEESDDEMILESSDDEDIEIDDIEIIGNELDLERIQIDSDFTQLDETSEVINGANNVVLPKQMRCGSHIFSLVSGTGFQKCLAPQTKKSLDVIFRKLRRVWSIVRRSSIAKEICQQICGRMLVVPNDTRWNSLYDACKVVLSLKINVSKYDL